MITLFSLSRVCCSRTYQTEDGSQNASAQEFEEKKSQEKTSATQTLRW